MEEWCVNKINDLDDETVAYIVIKDEFSNYVSPIFGLTSCALKAKPTMYNLPLHLAALY